MDRNEELFKNQTNFKTVLLNLYGYRKYYIIVLSVLIFLAVMVNKYSSLTYQNYTTLLVKEDNSNNFLASDNIMKGLGMMKGIKNMENEIGALTSFSLINSVLNQLDFKVSYYHEKKMFPSGMLSFLPFAKIDEIYTWAPVEVIVDQSVPQPVYARIYYSLIDSNKFILRAEEANVQLFNYIDNDVKGQLDSLVVNQIYSFGQEINLPGGGVLKLLLRYPGYVPVLPEGERYFFELNNMNALTFKYMKNLTVEPFSQASTLFNISVKGENPEKITNFLNVYVSTYLNENLEKKNRQALSSIMFIDSQISDVADSLSQTASSLQVFRSQNQVMDLSFQGQKIFEKVSDLENQRANMKLQVRYYNYIQDYFQRNTDLSDLVAPSAMNVVDPILSQLIGELIRLNSERIQLTQSTSAQKNLYLNNLDVQINNVKNTILESVRNNLANSTITLNEIEYRISRLEGDISRLPKTELSLLNIERRFKLNDAIYTFLLQKRSEAQILRASNSPDYEVVDNAMKFKAKVVSPRKGLNYALALFFGLLLPTMVILVRDFFNNKVLVLKDIENITDNPILGHIYHNSRKSNLVITKYPKSSVTESFRTVRTNLQFFTKHKGKQVILLTSSHSGEGKSFCAINLASAFALFNKKTILVGFDLRRPKLAEELGLTNLVGVSSYLINKAVIEDIIVPSPVENLDIITSGPIPPNPLELVASEKTAMLLDQLKETYDYIIIDSAPVGVVTDSLLLMKYADVNIYVSRQNYTYKEALKNTLKNLSNNKIENIAMLLNDVRRTGQSYQYGYDSKYYTDTADRPLVNKLLKRS